MYTCDLLSTFATFLLDVKLGLDGVWLLDHVVVICRICDKQATEAELENLTDLLEHEACGDEQEQEEQDSAVGDTMAMPLLQARMQEEFESEMGLF